MASFKNFNPSIGPSALQTAIGTAQNLADRSLLAQDKIRRQESEDLRNQALTASIAYQAEDRKQKQKVLKGQELSQKFAATAVDDFINNPFRFVDEDGNFDVSALAETKYGPFNLQSSYSQYKNLIDTEGVDAEGNSLGLIPDINTFQNTYDTLSNMESMNKLNSIMQYAQEKEMSKDTFNKFLRGAGGSQGFTGSNLIENLFNQTTPEYYQTFVANTGFEPRYQTFGESINPFAGPKKATPGQIITTGGAAIGTGIIGKKVLGSEAFRGKPSQFTAYNVDPKETLKVLRQQAKDLGVKTTDKGGKNLGKADLLEAIRRGPLPRNFDKASAKQLHDWIDKNAPDMKKAVTPEGKPDLKQLRKDMIKRANDLIDGKRFGGFNTKIGGTIKGIGLPTAAYYAAGEAGEALGGETGRSSANIFTSLATSPRLRKQFLKFVGTKFPQIATRFAPLAVVDGPVPIGDIMAGIGVTLEVFRPGGLIDQFKQEQNLTTSTPP